MAELEKRSFVDSFLDFDDACLYLDKHLQEHAVDWDIEDAGIHYVNHLWRSGVIFTRKNEPSLDEIKASLEEFDV